MTGKKRVKIYGTLEYPLSIGNVAFIEEKNRSPRITSAVQRFFKLPSGTFHIETRNTYYILKPLAALGVGGKKV